MQPDPYFLDTSVEETSTMIRRVGAAANDRHINITIMLRCLRIGQAVLKSFINFETIFPPSDRFDNLKQGDGEISKMQSQLTTSLNCRTLWEDLLSPKVWSLE
jgi:hypothetical protein